MNIGASHFPVVCTCSACVPAGAAVKSTLIKTPLDVSRNVAVPIVFPIASLIVADAVPDGACANASEPVSSHAEAVTSVFMTGKVTKSVEVRRKPNARPFGRTLPQREFDLERDEHGDGFAEAGAGHEPELFGSLDRFLIEAEHWIEGCLLYTSPS